MKYVENVIPLSKLIGLLFLFCLPLLSILFLKTKRNDLARPVMGTIFLVIIEGAIVGRALGCSIEISRVICMSVGLSTIVYGKPIQKNGMPKCVGGITWSKHAHAHSQFCEFETKCRFETLILPSSGRSKPTCDTRIIHFYYTLE